MQVISSRLVSFVERKNNIILATLISTVVLSGMLYSFSLGDNLPWPDEKDYFKLASNIISTHQYSLDGVHPTAYRPPGYPLILSLFVFLGADIVHLRILNFIALGLCMYLLHKILKDRCSPFAATIGALLVVCYPVLYYTAGALLSETIGALLFLLIILLLTRTTKSYRVYFLSGLLFGYLILTIPIFVLILFGFVLWSYFCKISIDAKGISMTVVVAFLLVSIWCIRNYAVFNSFVFVSSNGGENLLLGNSENTTPNSGSNEDIISKYVAEASQFNLQEVEQDRYYRAKAIEFALNHKIYTLKLYAQKFLNYFNYRNKLATEEQASSVKDFVMLITYGPLLLLFACRIFLMKLFRPSAFETLLIILYLWSGLSYAVFFTRIRFRLPFDFLLIIVVAMFLHKVARLWLINRNTVARMI